MIEPREFLRTREICPNLPEEIHKIAERIYERTKDVPYCISPQKLALVFTAVLEEKVLPNFELFPQLIDKMVQEYADGDDYATVFRKICQVVVGINPPFIVETEEYPENIKVAVEWWAQKVLFRTDIASMPVDFQKFFRRRYSEKEDELFKSTLAREIAKNFAIEEEGAHLSSKWVADEILERAGSKLGVNPYFGYPDAAMAIYSNEVKVSVDGGNTWETIFCTE